MLYSSPQNYLPHSPSSLPQKYDLLMCSAPAADFDCSGLHDARCLLNVVAYVVTQHSGCLHAHARMCLFVLLKSHTILSCRCLCHEHRYEPQLLDVERRCRAAAAHAAFSRPSTRERVKQPLPSHGGRHIDFIVAFWCVTRWAHARDCAL